MKELKDYLPFYLGCEVFGTYNDASGSRGYLTGVINGGTECEIQFFLEDGFNVEEEPYFNNAEEIKPLLRPLSDMTEDERERFGWQDESEFRYLSDAHQVMKNYYYGWQFIDLLKLHFDLFGLIESGLAIDKTLTQPK